MQKTGPIFDRQKLDWMNGKYLREHLTADEVVKRLQPYLPSDFPLEIMPAVLPLVRERLVTLKDMETFTSFFFRDITLEPSLLLKKATPELVKEELAQTSIVLAAVADWSTTSIEATLRALQEQQDWKKSQYFMLVRVAVTGQTATPPLFETLEVLGKARTLERLAQAQRVIS